MNNPNHIFATVLFALISLALMRPAPNAFGVSPAPDGGYPNFNTAEGQSALLNLDTTSGSGDTAVGWFSLFTASTASFNTGVGAGTLALNTADNNTAIGAVALFLNTDGTNNTAVGTAALLHNDIGSFNTAIGNSALFNNHGDDNTAMGNSALISNDTGATNTAVGFDALTSNIAGSANTAVGFDALANNGNANANTAVGSAALASSTGIGNTALGASAGLGVTTANNVIVIGTGGSNVTGSCFIGNIRGVTTAVADAIPVVIDSAHQLGTQSSSRRFKKEIKPMDKASEAILALKPVTFHYKSDTKGMPQFGLIAEEVAEVNPDLVVRDENGEIYSVRYDAVNAMLLNEFLKEHDNVQKLEARLKEQAAQIQKVSAQVEMSKPSPSLVSTKRD
jgi:hypothetical protein